MHCTMRFGLGPPMLVLTYAVCVFTYTGSFCCPELLFPPFLCRFHPVCVLYAPLLLFFPFIFPMIPFPVSQTFVFFIYLTIHLLPYYIYSCPSRHHSLKLFDSFDVRARVSCRAVCAQSILSRVLVKQQ
jgi:hypothetical protein